MSIISKLKFYGTVTLVNYDRNGAHIRLKLAKKEDILRGIVVEEEQDSYVNIPYWDGRDFESDIACAILSLAIDDTICITVEKSSGWFHTHTSYSITNISLKDVYCLGSRKYV